MERERCSIAANRPASGCTAGTRVEAALERERRIRDAAARADLPFSDALDEVDAFVRATEGTARRAQLLSEGLRDNPPREIELRLGSLPKGDAELHDALTHQLAVQRKMQAQLERFYSEMDRLVVEMDTIRSEIVSASVSEDSGTQRRAADDVRALRERLGATAEGMAEAYREPPT